MTINIDSEKMIDFAQFHDFAISKIVCDYELHTIDLPLLSPPYTDNATMAAIHFSDVSHFSIDIAEPWGEGIYICDIQCETETKADPSTLSVLVQLNSGDVIKLRCGQVML